MNESEIPQLCCARLLDIIGHEDHLIVYNEQIRRFGIPRSDDSNSLLLIDYCPYCGTKFIADVFAVLRFSPGSMSFDADPNFLVKVVEVLPDFTGATREAQRLNNLKMLVEDFYILQRCQFSERNSSKNLQIPEREWFDSSGQRMEPKYLKIAVVLRANLQNVTPESDPHKILQTLNVYRRWEDAFDEADRLNMANSQAGIRYFAQSTHWYPNGREVNSN